MAKGMAVAEAQIAPQESAQEPAHTGNNFSNTSTGLDRQDLVERAMRESSPSALGKITPGLFQNPTVQQTADTTANPSQSINPESVYSHVDRLAVASSAGRFDTVNTERQISADLRQLAERYGSQLDEKGLNQLTNRYMETRAAEREQAMLREVAHAARRSANENFDSNPAAGIDSQNKGLRLNEIARNYADVFNSQSANRLEHSMNETYETAFNDRHQSRFDNELNWAQRRYYGAKSVVSNALSGTRDAVISVGTSVGNNVLGLSTAAVAITTSPVQSVRAGVPVVPGSARANRVVQGIGAVGGAIRELSVDALLATVRPAGRILEGVGAVCELGLEIGTGVARGAKDLAVRAASGTYNFITDPETWKAADRRITSIVEGTWNGLAKAGRFVSDIENWKSAGRATWNGVTKAFDFVTDLENYKAAGRGIASAASATWNGIKAAGNFVTDKENWFAVGRGLKTAGEAVLQFGIDIVNDPAAAWEKVKSASITVGSAAATAGRAVGGFLYDVGKSIGVVDLATGLWDAGVSQVKGMVSAMRTGVELVKDFGRLAAGTITADDLKENFKNNILKTGAHLADSARSMGQAVSGAARTLGELTGINDIGRMCIAIYNGNWGEASMHLGFAAMSIGALTFTVATAGAGVGTIAGAMGLRAAGRSAGKVAIKGVSRTALGTFTNNVTQRLGSHVVKQASKGVQQAGIKVAKEAMATTTNKIIKQGVNGVTREGAFAMARATASAGAERAVYQAVKAPTTKVMQKYGMTEMKSVLKEMVKAGSCTAKEARLIEAAYRSAFRGRNPALLRHLSDGIEKVVKVPLFKSFNGGLREGIKEATPISRARLIRAGASPKHADELVAGMKQGTRRGAREGFEVGLKKGIRDGVKAAVKARVRGRVGLGSSASGANQGVKEYLVKPEEHKYRELDDNKAAKADPEFRRRKREEFKFSEVVNLQEEQKQQAKDTFSIYEYKTKKNAA